VNISNPSIFCSAPGSPPPRQHHTRQAPGSIFATWKGIENPFCRGRPRQLVPKNAWICRLHRQRLEHIKCGRFFGKPFSPPLISGATFHFGSSHHRKISCITFSFRHLTLLPRGAIHPVQDCFAPSVHPCGCEQSANSELRGRP
jgi:hypothetical protein